MAASISTSTIEALQTMMKLEETPATDGEEIAAKQQKAVALYALIKSKLLSAAAHCLDDVNEPEDEILYGTAGYLQTLLLLKQ